jgi:PAS domain-containing protein
MLQGAKGMPMEKVRIEQGLPLFSSGKMLGIIVAAVFFSELLVMLLLHLFEWNSKVAAFVDPFLLSFFLLPIFIFFIYRPVNDLLEERREYEKNLYQAYDAMEKTVAERTEELFEKNESLYHEITEKKKVEKELLEKNAFLEIVIESLDHPFYVIDAKTYEIRLANSAAGFKGGKKGTKCYELTHHRTTPCAGDDGDPCLVARVVETGKPQVAVHTHYHPDGSKRMVEVHTQPIFDEDNHVSSVIEFVMDSRPCDCGEERQVPNRETRE